MKFAAFFFVAVALLSSGCATSILARRIVRAPNQQFKPVWVGNAQFDTFKQRAIAETFSVTVGPREARLAVDVVEPGDYELDHKIVITPQGEYFDFRYRIGFRSRVAPTPAAHPLGTIVLLHGAFMSKEAMMHWALYLAEAGYRTVMVDLRGHGRSTGDVITFGKDESTDMMQLLDELQRRKLASDRVGVIGASYGAVVAIHWAARDPRVRALVALQPFSDPEAAIIGVTRGDFGAMIKHLSDDTLRRAIRRAPEFADFSWSEVDVLTSVSRLQVPLLIYHGTHDNWVEPAQSEAIVAIAPRGSEFHRTDGDHHVTLAVRLDPIAGEVLRWFNQRLVPRADVMTR